MGMLEIWKGVLTKPADTFKAEKKNATIGEGAKHLAIGYFVLGLVLGLAALLGLGALGGAAGAMLGVVGFIVSVVFYPVIG
ncbi:MAG: hypothetical protein QW112_00955, partial [Candidatus Micrarchaeia archaeon]